MNIKPYTPEMKETIMRMANKGWKYLKHIKSGKIIVSVHRGYYANPKYLGIHLLDYDNFSRHWVTFFDIEEILSDLVKMFYIEKKLAKNWEENNK